MSPESEPRFGNRLAKNLFPHLKLLFSISDICLTAMVRTSTRSTQCSTCLFFLNFKLANIRYSWFDISKHFIWVLVSISVGVVLGVHGKWSLFTEQTPYLWSAFNFLFKTVRQSFGIRLAFNRKHWYDFYKSILFYSSAHHSALFSAIFCRFSWASESLWNIWVKRFAIGKNR